MILLDGNELSKTIELDLKNYVNYLYCVPSLVVIQVGDNPASNSYIMRKVKFGKKIGVNVFVQKFTEDTDIQTLLECINYCNKDDSVNGIIIQLPLPKHLDTSILVNAIDPKKDVDGLGLINAGKLLKNENPYILPATPRGIITLLDGYNIEIEGKNIVVVGRSQLVGMPLSIMLNRRNATVTMTHSKTKNIQSITSQADILISACGVAHFIQEDFVKRDSIVIDVGSSFINGRIKGDVDFENVSQKVSAISPVPGGVGPMTVLSLFQNLLKG